MIKMKLLLHFKFLLTQPLTGLTFKIYCAVLMLTILTIILIGIVFLISSLKKKNEAAELLISAKLQNWFIEIILQEFTSIGQAFIIPNEINSLLQKKRARKVFLRELIDMKRTMNGDPGNNLTKLYVQLNLHVDSLKKLNSMRWHLKAKGIQELAIMDQLSLEDEIFNLSYHKNSMVRMEAQTAMVRLWEYKGLRFLDSLHYPLTEWHQSNLLQLLCNKPIESIEILNAWLKSSNPRVVQFALKLVGEHFAAVFFNEVVNCLTHPETFVRKQAVICLCQIPNKELPGIFINQFKIEKTIALKLLLLEELQKIAGLPELLFFQSLQHGQEADIILAAKKAVSRLAISAPNHTQQEKLPALIAI